MAQPASPQRPEATPAEVGLTPETLRKIKIAVVAVAVVAVAAVVIATYGYVSDEGSVRRWEELASLERTFADDATQAWASPPTSDQDIAFRDKHIRVLEDFLAKNAGSDAVAAHTHMRIAQLEITQILQERAASGSKDLSARYDRAKLHLETLRDKYPDFQANADRFKPADAGSVTRLSLDRLDSLRGWDAKHAIRAVEPDPDPVVVLRTTEGDIRLRFFASASPGLVRDFVERVCAGGLDGTAFFQRTDDPDRAWVRGGDRRTKGAEAATDDDRLAWGKPTPGEPRLPDEGRWRILHDRGVVSAWNAIDQQTESRTDDPEQFVVVTRTSPALDYRYTPFARVDGEASLSVLERLAGRRTRVQENSDIRQDPTYGALADQFATPVWVRKAFVYEKGALRACANAATADESERKLETLKLDAYREAPPAPPAPPATPPAPAMTEEPAMGG